MPGGINFFQSPIDTSVLEPGANLCLNADFVTWQRGATVSVFGATAGYGPDQWFVNNPGTSLTTWTGNQVQASGPNGNVSALKLTVGITVGSSTQMPEVYTALEPNDAQLLFNQTCSFSVAILGQLNVSQVGLQFCYAASAIKPTALFLGNEITFGVTTGGWVTGQINGVNLGQSFVPSGVVGVRVRPTAVTTGHIYDAGNGIFVAQPYWSVSQQAITIPFKRRYAHYGTELSALQRFYEKSYDVAVAPATNTSVGANVYPGITTANGVVFNSISFRATKRAQPTITLFTSTGTSGSISPTGAAGSANVGVNSFAVTNTSGATVASQQLTMHWVAEAAI